MYECRQRDGTMIDFKEIPEWWALCSGYGCGRTGECLRHLAYKEASAKVERWTCVLPTVTAEGECRCFHPAVKVRMACGFDKLYSLLKSRDARYGVRVDQTNYFGSKGTYYRYKHGERRMSPEVQEVVTRKFREYGYECEMVFDSYSETYDVTFTRDCI